MCTDSGVTHFLICFPIWLILMITICSVPSHSCWVNCQSASATRHTPSLINRMTNGHVTFFKLPKRPFSHLQYSEYWLQPMLSMHSLPEKPLGQRMECISHFHLFNFIFQLVLGGNEKALIIVKDKQFYRSATTSVKHNCSAGFGHSLCNLVNCCKPGNVM